MQPCSKQIERVDHTGPESTAEATDESSSPAAGLSVFLVTAILSSIADGDGALEIFKRSKIESGIREDPDKTHG